MLSIESIRNLRTLLNRVTIQGGEVEPFTRILAELTAEEFLIVQVAENVGSAMGQSALPLGDETDTAAQAEVS